MNTSYLSLLIQRQAQKYGERVALKYRDYATSTWIPVRLEPVLRESEQSISSTCSFRCAGSGDIGVFSQNKPECLYTDFGAFGVRAVTVPLYATSSEAQVHYILQDAAIRFLFVGEQYQYDVASRVQNLCHTLKRIIVFHSSVKLAPGNKIHCIMKISWLWGIIWSYSSR